MKIKVTYIAVIPDYELKDANISLTDIDAIQEYFYDNGGQETYYDRGEDFEIV